MRRLLRPEGRQKGGTIGRWLSGKMKYAYRKEGLGRHRDFPIPAQISVLVRRGKRKPPLFLAAAQTDDKSTGAYCAQGKLWCNELRPNGSQLVVAIQLLP